MQNEIEIYTDGACLDNPGPGGWGAILLWEEETKRISGSVHETTSQQMELLAAAKGLEALLEPSQVVLYTDSAYLVNAFDQHWLASWKRNNWQRKKGELKNKFLWFWLDTLTDRHQVKFQKVKGHSGVKWNEAVDDLAREAARKIAGGGKISRKKQETEKKKDLPYQDKLKVKAEEFMSQLEKEGLEGKILDVFKHHVTLSITAGDSDYGNLRIYYKPSNNSFSLGFQELDDLSSQEKLQAIWSN